MNVACATTTKVISPVARDPIDVLTDGRKKTLNKSVTSVTALLNTTRIASISLKESPN